MTKEERNARRRAYYATDKLKPLTEELIAQRAKRKAKRKAYDAKPEVQARARGYKTSAAGIARRNAHYAANKERIQAQNALYAAKPEVKARTAEYSKKYLQDTTNRLKVILNNSRRSITLKGRAARKLEHTITLKDLVDLYDKQGGKCVLTGRELSTQTNSIDTISLDRIDNDQGYTVDNIQLITAQANRAKNKWTQDEFISMCRAVINTVG